MSEKKKSSTFKWIAIGCLIPTLLLIIASIGIFVFGYKFIKDKASMDPKKSELIASSIMKYRLEGGSTGIFSFSMLGWKMAAVQNAKKPVREMLTLASFPPSMGESAEKSFQDATDRQFRRKGRIKIKSFIRYSDQLCGKKVEVRLQKGEMTPKDGSTVPMIILQSSIMNQNRLKMIMIFGLGSGGKASVTRIFRSLRCP